MPKNKDIRKDKEIEIPKESESLVEIMKQGIQSQFWIELKKIIQANVDFLSRRIMGETDEEFTDEQLRFMIKWRNINKNLIDLPEDIIQTASQSTGVPISTELDPYFKTYKEILEYGRSFNE